MEQYIHSATGELTPVDPYEVFCTPGTKVRMIDAESARRILALVDDGEIGVVSASDAEASRMGRRTHASNIKATWPDGRSWWVPIKSIELV